MSDLDAIFRVLAQHTGAHPALHEALVQAMLAHLSEEPTDRSAAPQQNYFELLDQIEQQRSEAQKFRKRRTFKALKTLRDALRAEIQRTALALHQALRDGDAGTAAPLAQSLGLNSRLFSTGFPAKIALHTISERYLTATQDLHVFATHFPDRFAEVRRVLVEEQQQAARHLWPLAEETLATLSFSDPLMQQFQQDCDRVLKQRRAKARQIFASLIAEAEQSSTEGLYARLDDWLALFGVPSWDLLADFTPRYRRMILSWLACSHQHLALEALVQAHTLTASERFYVESLLTVRFGQNFVDSRSIWLSWLEQRLTHLTCREEALAFWREHPDNVPGLLAAHVATLHLPDALREQEIASFGEPDFADLLQRRRPHLSEDEIHLLDVAQRVPDLDQVEEARLAPETEEEMLHYEIPDLEAASLDLSEEAAAEKLSLTESLEERTGPEPTDERMEEKTSESDGPSPLLEGVVGAAADYAIEGNLLESAIVSTIHSGSESFGARLSVTLDDDEAAQAPPKSKKTGLHFRDRKPTLPPQPSVQEEETESIWRDHLFPFITQNWAFVLAGSMIFTGLLVLEFYFWDKQALIRYGLSPFLILLVSYFLTRMGRWLKGEDIQSESPILIIQSVAVLLAPMSLLFVALLVGDRLLSLWVRIAWGAGMALLLLAAWGYLFMLAATVVHRALRAIQSRTLLLLNALLLLVPITQLTLAAETSALTPGTRAILVAGFYTGFLLLGWNMRRVLRTILTQQADSLTRPMIFYAATTLGTFLLVWGLTHARLAVLPQTATYSPLLLLLGFHLSLIEFTLLEYRKQSGRITSLSYSVYFLMGLGVLLSIDHDYLRVITLMLAGLLWLYQAIKLEDARHFNVATIILTAAFSMIALIQDFPPPLFPYLTALVVSGLYLLSLTFPYEAVAQLAARLSPIYMSFAFIVSIIWQWSAGLPPLSYGLAFVLFGLFSLYLGAKTDRLIHVHAGAGYLVAALPYLGAIDMTRQTLEGNFLVFSLAVLGIGWTMLSSATRAAAIRDSRSTVLWNIGMLAFSLMCLRVIFGDALDPAAHPGLQFQILSGPLLIAALMLLAAYFTRSYVPVYLALVIVVLIFPEIKDRFNIPMYSGLGSAMSGIGFLALAVLLRPLKRAQAAQVDVIWRQKAFPAPARDAYHLYATPIRVAAFFLFTRTLFLTYPQNYFNPQQPFSIKTPLAVLLCGTAYLLLGFAFRKIGPICSYIGFVAIFFGIIHGGCVAEFWSLDPVLLPCFMLAALLYCHALVFIFQRVGPHAESDALIARPFWHLHTLALWAATGFYALYSGYHAAYYGMSFFYYWLPLLAYFCLLAGWRGWQSPGASRSWLYLVPGVLIFWQALTLLSTRGDFLPYLLNPTSRFYLSTALMVLGCSGLFLIFEHTLSRERFRALAPILWMMLLLTIIFSGLLTFGFYVVPQAIPRLLPQLLLWAISCLLLGRFLSLGPLWLWSVFLLHLLALPAGGGFSRFYLSFHPLTLACIALALALFSVISVRFRWLFAYKYAFPWANIHLLTPGFLFAAAAHLVTIYVFIQAAMPSYRHAWMTVAGLFVAAFPALFAAHQVGVSRHFLFGLPYTLAWIGLMLAVGANFPNHAWLRSLSSLHLIAGGLLGALLTSVAGDWLLPSTARSYRLLQYLGAGGILGLVIAAFLAIRNVALLPGHWLLVSALLSLGAGLWFRLQISRTGPENHLHAPVENTSFSTE